MNDAIHQIAFQRSVPVEPTRWRRLLQRFAGTRPARVIPDGQGGILFMRYFLFRIPHSSLFGRWAGGQAYLHHYLRPDTDRTLHNHPWDRAVAVQLAGGYTEMRHAGFESNPDVGTYVTEKVRCRRPGSAYFLDGDDFHTVSQLRNDTSWSFFMHARYTKTWGFLEPTACGHIEFRAVDSATTLSKKGSWWRTAPKGAVFHEVS